MEITKLDLDEEKNLIVKDLIAKKELSNLNHRFVLKKFEKFLEENRKIREKFASTEYSIFKKSKEYKEIIKTIRSSLRKIYGVFILKKFEKIPLLVEELKKDSSSKNYNKILSLHKSSNERLNYYSIIYKKIFDVIEKTPARIVDLACGMNPFSYSYLGFKPKYLAIDLSDNDMNYIKTYFNIMKIDGSVKSADLLNDNVASLLQETDVVFLFKALDSLEAIKKNSGKKLIEEISKKVSTIVVSFPTISIGGRKRIDKKQRAWFEKLSDRLGFEINSFEIPGELFYILSKKN